MHLSDCLKIQLSLSNNFFNSVINIIAFDSMLIIIIVLQYLEATLHFGTIFSSIYIDNKTIFFIINAHSSPEN